jgi:hypothetical protein
MPQRDYYLTLSQAQSATTSCSSNLNSPFDTGNQITSRYGQSPYQTTNLNTIPGALNQSVKKFFFIVNINSGASGGNLTSGVTISLMQNATAGVVGRTAAISLLKCPKPYLTAGASPYLVRMPLPEILPSAVGGRPIQRYLNALYTISSTMSKFKLDTYFDTY